MSQSEQGLVPMLLFAHALPRLRLRIHEIKALKIHLFCSWIFTTSDNSKSCKFQAAITKNTRLQNQHWKKGCKQRETSRNSIAWGWHTSTLQAKWPLYYKGQSYVCRLSCIKGHFYVQGINLMYHRSLYYKGQSYVLSFQSNQSGMYPSHTHIHKIVPYIVVSIPPYKAGTTSDLPDSDTSKTWCANFAHLS